MGSYLVVTDKNDVFSTIRSSFPTGSKITRSATKAEALSALKRGRSDIVFIELDILCDVDRMDDCKDALHDFWDTHPGVEIVILSGKDRIRDSVRLLRAGASDYLTLPLDRSELGLITQNLESSKSVESELDYLRERFWHPEAFEMLQTGNRRMKELYEKVRSVAQTISTVLLIGDTGTGKGVVARLIHRISSRSEGPFISIHCGAMPDTLIESELFGHEKGSFTGATAKKAGKFEIARGGTIFLDEISTISPSAQIKLLQVLQDKTFQRVGGVETISADVRVITATNRDLKKMCEEGLFRKDLYYRLNVFPIECPSLSERTEDIQLFVSYFIKKFNRYSPKLIHSVHPEVMRAFKRYNWPGNIRELENLMERAFILEKSQVLTRDSFPNEIFEDKQPELSAEKIAATLHEVRRKAVEEAEREYLGSVLSRHSGRIKAAAEEAGITTRQLNKLMNRYSLHKEEFKK